MSNSQKQVSFEFKTEAYAQLEELQAALGANTKGEVVSRAIGTLEYLFKSHKRGDVLILRDATGQEFRLYLWDWLRMSIGKDKAPLASEEATQNTHTICHSAAPVHSQGAPDTNNRTLLRVNLVMLLAQLLLLGGVVYLLLRVG